jgi:hypothetical protein
MSIKKIAVDKFIDRVIRSAYDDMISPKEDTIMYGIVGAEDLVGQSLKDYVVELWYQVIYDTDAGEMDHREYFKSRDLAVAVGEKLDKKGQDITPRSVYVLTKKQPDKFVYGLIIGQNGIAQLADEKRAIEEVRKKNEPLQPSAETKRILKLS